MAICIGLFLLLPNLTLAFDNVFTRQSIETNCTWWKFDFRLYEWDNKAFYDNFYWNPANAWVFWFLSSKIFIYNDNWVLATNPSFFINSQIQPEWINWVRLFTSNVVGINKPWNWLTRNDIAAQIVYEVTSKSNIWYINWTATDYTYMTTNEVQQTIHYDNKPNFDNSPIVSDIECQNIYISWCWDWTKDAQETCDPNDTTKNWWGIWWCSNTCTANNSAPISWICWTDNWATLNSTPANLCSTWNSSVVSWAWPWTWSCNWINWWANVNCSANLQPWTIINWVCWTQNWSTSANKPSTNLCSSWNASVVSWTWPWTWSCNWINWWTNANCNASKWLEWLFIASWWWSNDGWWAKYFYSFCWDWKVEWDEQCDDWNKKKWDWCTNACTFESSICWNWKIEKWEQCDDWNKKSFDWCNFACLIEWTSSYCWNWKVEIWETCDDWNTNNNDKCNNICFDPKASKLNTRKLVQSWPSDYSLIILLSIIIAWTISWRKLFNRKNW